MAILVWLLPARLWRASLVRPCLAPAPFPEELPCQAAPRSAAAILAGCFESDKQISSCRKTFGCAPKGGKRGLPVLPTLERARGRAVGAAALSAPPSRAKESSRPCSWQILAAIQY